MLTWMPKSSCSGTHSCSQRVHGSQTLLKSARHHFYPNLSLSQDKLNWKTSLWIRSKMVGLFLNTSTADHMYSAHTSEKIQQQVQTQLSWNWKTIPHIAIPFLKSTWNSALLKKKISLIGQIFWKLLTPKNLLTWMPKSSSFRTPSLSQSVHGS